MKEMYNNYKKELSKKNNILLIVAIIFILGLVFGSIYITILNNSEKGEILNQVTNYFSLNNKLGFEDKIDIFKNTLISNLLFVISMWILGISVIGIPIVFIMIFFKSFVIGFSVSSIFAKYGIKGLIGVLVYLFPSQITTSIFAIFLAAYSIIISFKVVNGAFLRKNVNFKSFMGRYSFILVIGVLISILCSLFDAFISPSLTKLFTNLIK